MRPTLLPCRLCQQCILCTIFKLCQANPKLQLNSTICNKSTNKLVLLWSMIQGGSQGGILIRPETERTDLFGTNSTLGRFSIWSKRMVPSTSPFPVSTDNNHSAGAYPYSVSWLIAPSPLEKRKHYRVLRTPSHNKYPSGATIKPAGERICWPDTKTVSESGRCWIFLTLKKRGFGTYAENQTG